MEVSFYERADDRLLKFAVIVSRSDGKWVFCKHKERSTYECPGGHREVGETITKAAERELYEETGAVEYTLKKVCVYSVYDGINETYGMLFYADIHKFGELPELEIEKVELFDELPGNWTYPMIQPLLLKRVESLLSIK